MRVPDWYTILKCSQDLILGNADLLLDAVQLLLIIWFTVASPVADDLVEAVNYIFNPELHVFEFTGQDHCP